MGRLFKVVGIVAGALVVLLVVAAVLVGILFDPNDYKQQITAAVANATGRELVIDGDLELELLPAIAIGVGSARLSNAPGFTADDFVSIDSASLRVALLPLISGRVAVAEAVLDGLEVNLERNAAGANNWQDLGGSSAGEAASADEPAADGGTGDFDLAVDRIVVSNANVSWRDGGTGTEWLLTDFGMQANNFGFDRAFPLEISFGFAGPDIEIAVEANTQATLDLTANAYRLDDLDVGIDGNGAAWPGGGGSASLSFSTFAANLDQQTLALDDLVLEIFGLSVAGTLRGESLFDNLALSGGIEIAEFDPNDVLDAFGTEIETADGDVFRRASARADFVYNAREMGMRNTSILLDDSTLTGSLGFVDDVLRFDLAVDAINIDHYLPPASDAEAAEPDEGSIDEVDLPLDPLREFAANGRLALGTTQFMGLTMTDATFTLTLADGRLRLVPAASLYGGGLEGSIDIVVDGDSARFSLVQRLTGVDLNGLAVDYLDTDVLSGTGNVNLDLMSTGSNLGAMRQTLSGTASFAATDGAWEGIDAWYELRRARAVIQSSPVPEREGPPRTTFSSVSVSGVVADGVLTTDDLNATLPFMALDGAGTVGLFDNALDMRATAALTDGPTLQSDPGMAEFAGASLPLTVSGTLDAPSILPDFAGMIRARVQSALDEERNEAEERVDREVDEAREDLQDRVRDRLRGILDR